MTHDIIVTFFNVKYEGNCKRCNNPVDVNDMLPYVVFPYGTSHTVLQHADCFEDYVLEYNEVRNNYVLEYDEVGNET